MKEKQRNKPNSYGKLTKRMLISLGIGGVFGCFAGIFMTFGVKNDLIIFYIRKFKWFSKPL